MGRKRGPGNLISFCGMIFRNLFKQYRKQGSLVLRSTFLATLSPFERHEFLQFCHRRKYKEGEYIYYHNDPGTGMYFIESGEIELIVEAPGSDGEKREFRSRLSEPQHFGELSLGYDFRRMSSARCTTDCVLLGFFKPDLVTLKKRHPSIAATFLEALSILVMRQLERTTRKLEEATDPYTAVSFRFEPIDEKKEEEQTV